MNTLWQIEMLGWLRATQGERVVSRFQTQKTAALLAFLAYHLHRSHPREALIELFWPESEPGAGRNSLSKALSSLRHQLEPPGVSPGAVLLADRHTVQLNPAACTTDVAAFESALQAAAQAGTGTERVQRLADAAELYRGELLPGYFDQWILPERQRLAEAYLGTLSRLTALLQQAGDLPGALLWARRAVAADPLREECHHVLIRLLVAAGRAEEALDQYHELERRLQQDLGAAPATEIRDLVREIEQRRMAQHGGTEARREGEGEREDQGSRRAGPLPHPAAPPASPHSSGPPYLDYPRQRVIEQPSGRPSLPTGTVTFLLTDIEGSTALWERTGEAYSAAQASHHELLRKLFDQYGGHEVKELGDGFIVAFQRAGDALACGVATQRALATHRWPEAEGHPQGVPLRVRVALHTGDVELQEGEYHGLVLHYAQRVLLAGHGGQILCSEGTATLLRRNLEEGVRLVDLGVYRLRDVASPERLFQVEYPGMAQREFPPPNAEAGYAGNLPLQFTRFFGREEEIARLRELLVAEEARLVTLTGPGGTGKTRLALAAAERLRKAFEGAIWFVPLADLADPDLIADKALEALRLPRSAHAEPLEQVVAFLRRQRALLVLDNFEHLVEGGAPLLQTLRKRVDGLTCLVTSRRCLHLPGEREVPVAPLPVDGQWLMADGPAKTARSDPSAIHHQLLTNASVQLFVDRAQAVRPDFQLTPGNAEAIATLCARLEGLPLAVELAASRVRGLTPRQMLDRIEQRFDLLVSGKQMAHPRHQSLRAALGWSYQFLSPELQRFFCRLSVFRGGCTLEAAEAVGEEPRALAFLEELARDSLVQTAADGEAVRYRLLETFREYGAEQLSPEELAALGQRHLEYFRSQAERAELGLMGSEQETWLEYLETEHDNVRAALDYALTHQLATEGFRVAGALWRFWALRGYLTEGRERLAMLLALPPEPGDARARAKAQACAGLLALFQGDLAATQTVLAQSLATGEESNDPWLIAFSRTWIGFMAYRTGHYELARANLERALQGWRSQGHRWGTGAALEFLGRVAFHQGHEEEARRLCEESLAVRKPQADIHDIAGSFQALGFVIGHQGEYETARSLYEQSLVLFRRLRCRNCTSISLQGLGDLCLRSGDLEGADSFFREGLSLWWQLGNRRSAGECLEGLAGVAEARGRVEQAARLGAAAAALREARSSEGAPGGSVNEQQQRISGLSTVDWALQAGPPALSPEQVVAEALEQRF